MRGVEYVGVQLAALQNITDYSFHFFVNDKKSLTCIIIHYRSVANKWNSIIVRWNCTVQTVHIYTFGTIPQNHNLL